MIWGENPLFSETSTCNMLLPLVFLLKMIILGCCRGTTILGNLHIIVFCTIHPVETTKASGASKRCQVDPASPLIHTSPSTRRWIPGTMPDRSGKQGGWKVSSLCQCNGILLMEEILHQLIGSLSHYLQGFIHPKWCRISSTNRISCYVLIYNSLCV